MTTRKPKQKIPLAKRLALYRAHNKRCQYCDEPLAFSELWVDHIIPQELLGKPKEMERIFSEYELDEEFKLHDWGNWLPAHVRCNQKKGRMVFRKKAMLYYLEIANSKVEEAKEEEERVLRSQIEPLALQEELDYVRDELAEYRCPYCEAPFSSRGSYELDAEIGVIVSMETFACGYTSGDEGLQHFCPSDPRFPKFEEFALDVRESNGQWTCYARPITKNARYLSLLRGVAWSEQEARDQVLRGYERAATKWKP